MNKKIVKISIYNSRCTPSQVIQGNGDAILDNICISADTDENLETGEYYLDAIFLIDNEGLWSRIQEESVLKVQMDYGEEYFRIAKVQSTSRDITVFARQETIYQTLHMWLEDVRPEGRNGLSALTHIKDNSNGPKNIKVSSDISTISTAYYQDMNMYKALHDCDQSFMNRWGGEIQRRGYNLTINKRIGTHRGVQIRSRKNLTGFEANVDIDNVFTRIKPVGYDGITIDGFVTSPLILNYPLSKTTTIKYDDVKVKDPEQEDSEGFNTLQEAQTELIRLSELEFSQNNIDKIKASYRINFVQLEQTEEYKNYVAAERVFLGDEVDVYEETLDINITVRAMRRKYDVLRQRVKEVELSNESKQNKPPTIGDILDNLDKIENDMQDNNNWYKDAINNATDLIQNGLKDSYVVVKKNEILIMDTTDINTATNVWRFNKGGLGFSNTGYYGTYETAITMDGSIVGKFITGLIINGNQINAKNLRVIDVNGEVTFEVDNYGRTFINGSTTVGNSNGDKIRINNADYEVYNGSTIKGFFGLRTLDDNRNIMRLVMSHDGLDKYTNDYFTVNAYPGNNNPLATSSSYIDLGYRCQVYKQQDNWGDVSNIRMLSDGDIRVAPIKNLKIYTGFQNGSYNGSDNERLIAEFGSSSSSYYDTYLDINAIRKTVGNVGLILAHYNDSGQSALVRIGVDSTGFKAFRPLTSDGDISLGSVSYPFAKVTTVAGTYSSDGVYMSDIETYSSEAITTDNVLDNIFIYEPSSVLSTENEQNKSLVIDVTNIKDTHYVDISEEGTAYMNTNELLKLALKEIKQLKEEIKAMKEGV